VASSLVDDDDLEVSLFDDVIRLYQMLLENMLDGIKSYVFDDVKARSRPYRTEKYVRTMTHTAQTSAVNRLLAWDWFFLPNVSGMKIFVTENIYG